MRYEVWGFGCRVSGMGYGVSGTWLVGRGATVGWGIDYGEGGNTWGQERE
jgi:hypothetical protein